MSTADDMLADAEARNTTYWHSVAETSAQIEQWFVEAVALAKRPGLALPSHAECRGLAQLLMAMKGRAQPQHSLSRNRRQIRDALVQGLAQERAEIEAEITDTIAYSLAGRAAPPNDDEHVALRAAAESMSHGKLVALAEIEGPARRLLAALIPAPARDRVRRIDDEVMAIWARAATYGSRVPKDTGETGARVYVTSQALAWIKRPISDAAISAILRNRRRTAK